MGLPDQGKSWAVISRAEARGWQGRGCWAMELGLVWGSGEPMENKRQRRVMI
jgi:hypothetical protein